MTHTQHKAFCPYQCLCLCVRGVCVVAPPGEPVHGSGEAIPHSRARPSRRERNQNFGARGFAPPSLKRESASVIIAVVGSGDVSNPHRFITFSQKEQTGPSIAFSWHFKTVATALDNKGDRGAHEEDRDPLSPTHVAPRGRSFPTPNPRFPRRPARQPMTKDRRETQTPASGVDPKDNATGRQTSRRAWRDQGGRWCLMVRGVSASWCACLLVRLSDGASV